MADTVNGNNGKGSMSPTLREALRQYPGSPFSDEQHEEADYCRKTMGVKIGDLCPVNIPGRMCLKFCKCGG